MKKCGLLFAFLLLLLHPIGLYAESLYYILDASGSMWGRIDGVMKIVEAKKILTQLLQETPSTTPVGLTVYGGSRKGDCSDIVEVFPLQQLTDSSKEIRISELQTISPMGKTPLTESVKRVASATSNFDDNITIVLISDGIETCNGKPCEVIRELHRSNTKLVLHTVGFDVDIKASKQLSCLAKGGGGQYFSAANGDELLAILHNVQHNVIEDKKIEEVAPPAAVVKQEVKSASKSIRIKAAGPGKIRFDHDSWLKVPKYWKLIDPETGDVKGQFNSLATTLIPPGEYQLLWKQCEHGCSEVALTEIITVKSGKTSVVPLRTALQLQLPDWIKKPKYWGLKHPTDDILIASFTHLTPFLVPAGTHRIVWKQSEHSAQEITLNTVTIEPDSLTTIGVQTGFNPVAADWLQKKIHYWGLRKKDDSSMKWSAWYGGTFSPQLVAPGSYDLYYDLSEHGSSDSYLGEVVVHADQMNDFSVNTGVSFIPSEGLGKPYLIEFIELAEGKETRKVVLKGSFGPIALAPATYRIKYRQKEHNDTTMTIVDSFDLPAGALVEIEL